MEGFFETKVSRMINPTEEEGESSASEKLEIVPISVSNGQEIVVGKNVLTYLESDRSRNAMRVENRVEELKNKSVLPKETEVKSNFLINKNDGGRFIELETKDNQSYFVKFRTLRIGNPQESQEKFETIVTSSCIFGFGGTKAKLQDGHLESFRNGHLESSSSPNGETLQRVVGWEAEKRISIYELEAISRITSFINSLVSNSTRFNKVVLNTPRVEYYLAGLGLYERGLLSSELFGSWFNLIDERTDRLNKLFKDRVLSQYSVEFRSPLEELRNYIVSQVKSGELVNFEDALEVLSQDKLWFETITVKRPTSWIDLVETSIAVGELRNSFQTGESTVVVKSPKQEGAAYLSRDIAKLVYAKYGEDFNLVGMYPHEQIVVSHDKAVKPLLSHVAEPMSVSSAKKIISLYRPQKTK
jgi:hypothetical protein